MTSNQYAQMQHVEINHWQSNIASWNAPYRGTPENIQYPKKCKNATGKGIWSWKFNMP